MQDNKEGLRFLKRKCRIVWIAQHELVGMFIAAAVACGRLTADVFKLQLPVLENLPQDIFIDSIFYDPARFVFGVIILHDTFKIVQPGEMPPEMNGTLGSMYAEIEIKGHQTISGNITIPH
jgi:hypothetical protein